MTNYNFDSQPEGDWEDRGNLTWNELDWQQFLHRQEREIARFLKFYDECGLEASERLDWVARQMGWDADDWSVSDLPEESDLEEPESWDAEPAGPNEPADTDPYTLHRHPVFVVCSGLFLQIRFLWRTALRSHPAKVNALECWDFSECLNEAERHSLIAMQCMDTGDLLLCVVHMKRALRGLNLAMSLLPRLAQTAMAGEFFRQAMQSRLFDLREVFLRVMQDCRFEDRRDFRD